MRGSAFGPAMIRMVKAATTEAAIWTPGRTKTKYKRTGSPRDAENPTHKAPVDMATRQHQ